MVIRFLRLLVDGRVPIVAKIGFLFFAGGYLLFPVDLIPDILPVVGIADDGGVLLASVAGFSSYAKRQIAKADDQKKVLSKGETKT